MPSPAHRILDANFNRAREALRVLEEHVRMVLDDESLSGRAKQIRHDLTQAIHAFGGAELLASRDIRHDVGAGISTEAERHRAGSSNVAIAAAKRASEALRCIEEYGKMIDADAAASVEQLRYRLYALEQDIVIGGPRRQKLRVARLHVLVTESHCRRPWLEVCEEIITGGADVIQLREKSLADAELLHRARQLRELTARHGVLLIINDRADIARLADADGVHLGQHDLPVAAARQLIGPNRLIGKSAHGVDEARAALAEDIDYLAVGPMFPSPTKPDVPVQGPKLLAEVASLVTIPLVAIGGITAENVAQVLNVWATVAAGAPAGRGVGQAKGVAQANSPWPPVSGLPSSVSFAICHAIIASPDPSGATRTIKARIC